MMRVTLSVLIGGAVLFVSAGTPAFVFGSRIVTVQSDWTRFDLEVRLEGHPESPWRETAEGPIGECRSLELRKQFYDSEYGYGNLLSTGRIYGPPKGYQDDQIWMWLVMDDAVSEPCGDYDCRGEIHSLWTFIVENECVNFRTSVIQEVTGISTLSLYDRTEETFLVRIENDHPGAENAAGLLQPFHEYTLSAYLEASIWDGTNQITFTTDGTFIPEPTTVLFLVAGAMVLWRCPRLHAVFYRKQ